MYLKNADKVPHETLEKHTQEFLSKGNKIKQVEPKQRSMPEFVWYMDDYPKRRWYTKK